ncbi:MAG: hypothetical protein M3Z24_05495 [Chloroflexota bacterium]|nr:hypothetical protein [Chloroflexota bacterium]
MQKNVLRQMNRVSFLLIKDSNGRTIVSIPLWPVLGGLLLAAGVLIFWRMRRS